MPIETDPGGSSGTTVNVEVKDDGGGPAAGLNVDVLFSWDPNVLQVVEGSTQPAGWVLSSSGSILWKKANVPSDGAQTFTAGFTLVGSDETGKVLYAALQPEDASRDSGEVEIPVP